MRSRSTWPFFFFAGLLVLALVLRIVQKAQPDDAVTNEPPRDHTIELTASACTAAGGTWNDCGSLCRLDPNAVCAQVCVRQCECISNDQCPYGYSCGAYVDGQGVCGVTSSP